MLVTSSLCDSLFVSFHCCGTCAPVYVQIANGQSHLRRYTLAKLEDRSPLNRIAAGVVQQAPEEDIKLIQDLATRPLFNLAEPNAELEEYLQRRRAEEAEEALQERKRLGLE